LIGLTLIEPLQYVQKSPVAKSSEDKPGKEKHGKGKKEGILWGVVRIVKAENEENDNKINDIVEHNRQGSVVSGPLLS